MTEDMHRLREKLRSDSRRTYEAIFQLAGFTVSHVWELANGYWPLAPEYDEVRVPWWLFMTEIGPVQIGYRKRVMHIEWTACANRIVVTEDQVTKSETYVHASSDVKAIEYLRALRGDRS